MKLAAHVRSSTKKSDVKQMRRAGKIPAVLYGAGKNSEQLMLDSSEWDAILRQMKKGHLGTTVFELDVEGAKRKAIVKNVQHELTSYRIWHIDFEELCEGRPVVVKVPIAFVNVSDCMGIKLGGFVRQVIRYLKVVCAPSQIPAELQVDIRDLGVGQSKRVLDIDLPSGVKCLAKLDEVVVVIASKRGS